MDEDLQGFVIQCGDCREEITVTAEQATLMAKSCPYFQHVFAHGTREAQDRILRKPDWSKATASKLVQLLTTERTGIANASEYLLLEEAAQQVILAIAVDVSSLVSGSSNDRRLTKEDMMNMAAIPINGGLQFCLKIPGTSPVPLKVWHSLLTSQVLILSKEGSSFDIYLDGKSERSGAFNEWSFWDSLRYGDGVMLNPDKDLTVHSHSQKTIGQIVEEAVSVFRQEGSHNQGKKAFNTEEFSLRVPCALYAYEIMAPTKIEELTGARTYLHNKSSLGYYSDGGMDGYCPTLSGTWKQLKAAFDLIPEGLISIYSDRRAIKKGCRRCSLRVAAPRKESLDDLIMALQLCHDNPKTLGVDIDANAFFAVKTVRDMKIMLNNLGSGATNGVSKMGASQSDLTLYRLTYPKGVF